MNIKINICHITSRQHQLVCSGKGQINDGDDENDNDHHDDNGKPTTG